MKRTLLVILCIVALAGFAMSQTYTSGAGITNVDKLGGHQNGGRGCVGCHAPHSGARGNGGNAAGAATTDPTTGDFALWGEDLQPLYNQTLYFGDADATTKKGSYPITLPADSETNESLTTGVMMCLSCHDGNIAKGAMMSASPNQSYEQVNGLLPASYGPHPIPTLLGNDGTAAGNYENDHPIGPSANLGAVGLVDHSNADPTKWVDRVLYAAGGCTSHGATVDCLQPNTADANYMAFYNHYGAFNVTQSTTANPRGGRTTGVVLPDTDPAHAYIVCTTCHTPHSMYTFSGTAGGVGKGTFPTYFFVSAPYNPGAPVASSTKASSATQFCRQCHFTGAGGANEGSGIMNVTTQY